MDACTVNGKLDLTLYNKIDEFKKMGFDDENAYRLIGSCVYKKYNSEIKDYVETADHKLLNKINVWYDIYMENLKDIEEIIGGKENYDYDSIARDFLNIMDKIDHKDCTAIDYVEKFMRADFTQIHLRLVEALVRDERGWVIEPRQYDTKIMDQMIEWRTKYGISENHINSVMYRINNQREVSKEDCFKYVNQLLEAGWEPKLFDQMHYVCDRNGNFDKEKVDLFTKLMKEGLSEMVIDDAYRSCVNYETNKFNSEQFEKLVDILKALPDGYRGCANWMHNLTGWSDVIIKTLQDGKVNVDEYWNFLRDKICSIHMMDGGFNEINVPTILDKIQECPDKLSEIISVVTSNTAYPKNEKYYKVCFNHLENGEWSNLLQLADDADSREYTLNLLSAVDTKKVDIETIGKYVSMFAFATEWSHYVNKENSLTPEFLEKFKEIIENKYFKNNWNADFVHALADIKGPEITKIIDNLIELEKKGAPHKLVEKVFENISTYMNKQGFYSNYQEIFDFYNEHYDLLSRYAELKRKQQSGEQNPDGSYPTMSVEDIGLAEVILKYRSDLGAKSDENSEKPEKSSRDLTSLRKLIEYTKQGISAEILSDMNICFTTETNDECIKRGILTGYDGIVAFLDKVDVKKYAREINFIFSYMYLKGAFTDYFNDSDGIFNPNISKQHLEFILDAQKAILDEAERSGKKPIALDNKFFAIFKHNEINEDALNKVRYYLEAGLSIPKYDNLVNVGQDYLFKMFTLYNMRPDKIEFFENLLFNQNSENRRIANRIIESMLPTRHSMDLYSKEILDVQVELLEEFLTYDKATDAHYRIEDLMSQLKNTNLTVEDIKAKQEVWKILKPKNNKNKELSNVIYTIYNVNANTKDIIIAAKKLNRFAPAGDLCNIANYTKDANKDLILELINDKKYTDEDILQYAVYTHSELLANFGKKLIDDGNYTREEACHILNGISERNADLASELCFNKDLKFPKEYIFNVLWSLTGKNEKLAWKICTNKHLNIPHDKIELALKCYNNPEVNIDMYISRFKMFLDLEFSDDFIQSILGTSGSIARYTPNFCKVLQHLQEKGVQAQNCVEILTSDFISDNITKNIVSLETLNLLDKNDIAMLKSEGIDVYEKIRKLQKSIDVKHPTIETKKGDEKAVLQVLANNQKAENVIKTMDLSQFEHGGIPLEYSREAFVQNMNRLIATYTDGESVSTKTYNDGVTEIPDLKLSETGEQRTKIAIEEYKTKYADRTQECEIIMDGKKYTALLFSGSHINGSNPGDFVLIDGNLYYVKRPNSDKIGQSVEEVIASKLYRAAGIDAPNEHYVYDELGNVVGMASEYIPDMKARDWRTASDEETKLMFESFAVDAWLANWDAPKNDNTQIYDDGKIIKSDVGGSLHYRARGEIKEDFNGIVNELLSLIENNAFYSKMTKQDVLNSIKRVLDIPDETIYQTIMSAPSKDVKLAEIMIRRKEYMRIFYEKLEKMEDNGLNIVDLILSAQSQTLQEFHELPDIAGALGYIPTNGGFEGLLNTQSLDKLPLTPEQKRVAEKMKAEIQRFTTQNRLADNAKVPDEVRNFVNGVLKGIPEFASYFGKPQHGNGEVDADGVQKHGHKYSLDIHILNVLQKSMNNPLYDGVDEFGFKLLDDESKIVLKFSALLHDIGKRYMSGRDSGHAELSAEYVYSVLDRFNLSTSIKNRIVNMVNNHHWFEGFCTGALNAEAVASMFRTTADFTIARILAQADLESVRDGFFLKTMKLDFPREVSNEKEAYQKFEKLMTQVQSKVEQLEASAPIVTPSKFVEVPEHIGSDGKVVPRRGFPVVEIELDGKKEKFQILNLKDLDPETDMYQYGFNHIKLKDLRLLVHRPGDNRGRGVFDTFKILGENPMRASLQSLSLITPTDISSYGARKYAWILEGNNSNIGVANSYNAGTGNWKYQMNLLEEIFGSSAAREVVNSNPKFTGARLHGFSENNKYRTFFKDQFVKFMETKGIKINDKTYAAIVRYVQKKQYIETQLKDLKIGNTVIKKEDLREALVFAREQLIDIKKQKRHGEHNEITEVDCKPVAGGAEVASYEELDEDFLRACRDNCNGRIIIY